ncbi:hypothetical protein D3C73_1191400 [compost metagenome]
MYGKDGGRFSPDPSRSIRNRSRQCRALSSGVPACISDGPSCMENRSYVEQPGIHAGPRGFLQPAAYGQVLWHDSDSPADPTDGRDFRFSIHYGQ